jgi:hypothetical protein
MLPEDDDESDMLELLQAGMPSDVAKDFINIYELLLIQGASRGIARAKVAELFSPPRVTEEIRRIPNLTIEGGQTYDLVADKNGRSWDFLKVADRKAVRKEIEEQKPFFVIGSPPCTPFSSLRFFNKHKKSYKKMLAEGRILLKFAAAIYGVHMAHGRHFLHEHPVGASSWQETCIKKVAQDSRVGFSIAHLCQYGMQSVDNNGVKHAVRKSTRFMSTSKLVLDQLGNTCKGEHEHKHLLGGRAKAASLYPPQLCRATFRGIEIEKQKLGMVAPRSLLSSLEAGCALYNLSPEQVILEEDPIGGLEH